jgi:hypothetical protein
MPGKGPSFWQTLLVSMPRIRQLNFLRLPMLIFSPGQDVSRRLLGYLNLKVSYLGTTCTRREQPGHLQ